MDTFKIEAKYLNNLVGRRAALPAGGALRAAIPLTIAAVRYKPETGQIIVDADAITHQVVGWALSPDTVVEIQHDPNAYRPWTHLRRAAA